MTTSQINSVLETPASALPWETLADSGAHGLLREAGYFKSLWLPALQGWAAGGRGVHTGGGLGLKSLHFN